jgi:hypothetical protein
MENDPAQGRNLFDRPHRSIRADDDIRQVPGEVAANALASHSHAGDVEE